MNNKILNQAGTVVFVLGMIGGVMYFCDNVYNLTRTIAEDICRYKDSSAKARKTDNGHASGEKAFKIGFYG